MLKRNSANLFTLDSRGIYTISSDNIKIEIGDGYPVTGAIERSTMILVEDGEILKI